MKVLRLHKAHDFRLHDEPIPEPSKGEALIRVTAVGICGSDLHWYHDGHIGDRQLTTPRIIGHEFAGVVMDGELKGKRVAVDPIITCGHCEFCRSGRTNLCPDMQNAGERDLSGGLCEYISWPNKLLYILPDDFTCQDGAMLEPLGIGIHAIELASFLPGDRVGIFGCGPIGLVLIQLAKLMGASQIIATDKLQHRLNVALSMGATNTFSANNGEEVEEILRLTQGDGVDIAYEASGDSTAINIAIGASKRGATVVVLGIPEVDQISYKASVARLKSTTIKMLTRALNPYPRAIRLVQHGLVDIRSLVSHTFQLDQYDEAFNIAQERKGLKVIITPTSG